MLLSDYVNPVKHAVARLAFDLSGFVTIFCGCKNGSKQILIDALDQPSTNMPKKKANEILLSEMIKLLDTIGCNQLPKMQPEQPHSRTDIK